MNQSNETRVTISELVTPEMANFSGKLHGGELLSLADKAAYVCASRYSGQYAVTAGIAQDDFHEPVEVGELMEFCGRVTGVGTSSMMIEIVVTAEDMAAGTSRRCATCYVTMVAMENGEPTDVPELSCETDEEFRDCLWAMKRRQLAREHREELEKEQQRTSDLPIEDIKNELQDFGKSIP